MKGALVALAAAIGVGGLVWAASHQTPAARRPGPGKPGSDDAEDEPGDTIPAGDPSAADVVFSLMALRELPPELGSARLIEVPGKITPPEKHPNWSWLDALRGPDGLVPGLLRHYGIRSARRIAVFGFSAGANAGLRAMLRDDADRERISFVGSIDGLHLPIDANGKLLDWSRIEPIYAAAIDAVYSDRHMLVATASAIAAPVVKGERYTRTADGLGMLIELVNANVASVIAPPSVPQAFRHARPAPIGFDGRGQFLVLFYGPSGDERQDHINQARVVAPLVASELLAPFWAEGAVSA